MAFQASGDSVGEKENGDSFNNVRIEANSQQGCSDESEKVNNEVVGHKSGVQLKELDGPAEENPEKNMIGCDSDMEIEDLNEAPLSRETICVLEKNGIYDLNCDPSQADCHSRLTGESDRGIKSENLIKSMDDASHKDGYCVSKPNLDENSHDNSLVLQVNAKFTETVAVAATLSSTTSFQNTKSNTVSGVKRTRTMFDEQNPSVCVKYNSLTRSSKCKLEELLQQWSEWHARHALSTQDADEAFESGEETFFPALHIGLDKASVSFWMDQQPRKQSSEFVPLDDKSVPMYDRGYALGLMTDEGTSNVERGLEIVDDASRCFNCGSYNHALKDCTKPRDNAVVNSARKQLKSKRNQNGSRNQARYYQNSPAGKYDGLRPGALDTETRKLLGLGEFDPPPWLNRMRELGYPPGYLDPDEEDQPSGIIIFADGEIKEEQEDGEIVDTVPIEMPKLEPKMKMTVEFPGINGPIPKNADERLWVDMSVNRLYRQNSANHSLEHISRAHHREERWSRLERRDDGPPGVDHGFNPALSTHLPRYSNRFESGYLSHSPRLELHGRSESERGRSRYLNEGSYGSSQYLSHRSPTDHGSLRHGNWVESRNSYDLDYSTYGGRDRQDRYRHLSRR